MNNVTEDTEEMKSPAFSFYVRDWLCSKTVYRLHSKALPTSYQTPTNTPNLCSRGLNAYMFLLCAAWLEEPQATLPTDDDELASMARVSMDEWVAIKPLIMPAFKLDTAINRYYNERQMEEAVKQQSRSAAATKNVAKRYQTPTKPLPPLEDANAIAIEKDSAGGGEGGTGDKGAETDRRWCCICEWFHRRLSTEWSDKEKRKFAEVVPDTHSDDFALLDEYYRSDEQYLRRDIQTLLNNWNGEIDRARAWKEKRFANNSHTNQQGFDRNKGTHNEGTAASYDLSKIQKGGPLRNVFGAGSDASTGCSGDLRSQPECDR